MKKHTHIFAGILINGLATFRLRSGKSLNSQMVTWHLIEDVLGWSAILVVGIILLFKNLPVLDPILSILIILYVLYHVVQNLKKTFAVFLQGPREISASYADLVTGW